MISANRLALFFWHATRLAFAISMVVEFDCFPVNEIIAVGDDWFHQKCHVGLFEKRSSRAIIVSHHVHSASAYGHRASVLHNGHLFTCASMNAAFNFQSLKKG